MKWLPILFLLSCDSLCQERVCKPDWSGDCVCATGQVAEALPSGLVVCRCKR